MFLLTGADLYFDISVSDRCHAAMIGMRCVGCNILTTGRNSRDAFLYFKRLLFISFSYIILGTTLIYDVYIMIFIHSIYSAMFPVIGCIAKKEHDYIEEFVKYHLALGFKCIYLYDNEDTPTYETLLDKYKNKVKVMHLPFNNYCKPVQYMALDDFVNKYLFTTQITHVAHIDIDEFIVLKKHKNICNFIGEYIVGDCQGIGMNWRFFGSSGKTEKTNEPNTIRFTMCGNEGNSHIKTLFKKDNFLKFIECHSVKFSSGHTKSTNNAIITGAHNHNIDFSVIQLNHYKCKTLPEFRYIRTRQRADVMTQMNENVDEDFKLYDVNQIEDLHARDFYAGFM